MIRRRRLGRAPASRPARSPTTWQASSPSTKSASVSEQDMGPKPRRAEGREETRPGTSSVCRDGVCRVRDLLLASKRPSRLSTLVSVTTDEPGPCLFFQGRVGSCVLWVRGYSESALLFASLDLSLDHDAIPPVSGDGPDPPPPSPPRSKHRVRARDRIAAWGYQLPAPPRKVDTSPVDSNSFLGSMTPCAHRTDRRFGFGRLGRGVR